MPRVSISSAVRPDEDAGGIGSEDRRKNGLKSFLGLDAHPEEAFLMVGEDPPLACALCSSADESGGDDVVLVVPLILEGKQVLDSSMLVHEDCFEVEKGKEETRDEERLLQPASESSKLEAIAPPASNPSSTPFSSASTDSSARGSGSGAKRILLLRVFGEELRVADLERVEGNWCGFGFVADGDCDKDWCVEYEETSVMLPDEEDEEASELFEEQVEKRFEFEGAMLLLLVLGEGVNGI